jgi:hypothetical protein
MVKAAAAVAVKGSAGTPGRALGAVSVIVLVGVVSALLAEAIRATGIIDATMTRAKRDRRPLVRYLRNILFPSYCSLGHSLGPLSRTHCHDFHFDANEPERAIL